MKGEREHNKLLLSQYEAITVSGPSLWFLAGDFSDSALLYFGSSDLLGSRLCALVAAPPTIQVIWSQLLCLYMIIFSLPLNLAPPWNRSAFKHYYRMALVRNVLVHFGPDLWSLPPEDPDRGLLPSCSLGCPTWLQPRQAEGLPRRKPRACCASALP